LAEAASPSTSRAGRLVLWLILATAAARLVTMAAMGLGMDESYTTAISRDLHLSYFDHPPLHQWIAHAAGEAFGYGRWVRLPFIALFAGSTWLMYRLGARLFGETAGAWAALTLNLSAFFSVAAGQWVLPDGPLVFFELAAVLCLANILFPKAGEAPRPWLWWLLAGASLGLAALSKYQAATVGLGLGLAFLILPQGRRTLVHPAPYVAKLLVLALIAPVIVWNAQHEWISFTFQTGRGAARHFDPLGLVTALLAQAGLLTPWVAVPLVWAIVKAIRGRDPRAMFLLIAAAPTVVLFNLLPLVGAKVLPHWPMPGWLLLFPLLGWALAASMRAWPRRWAAWSAAALALIWVLAVSDAASAWIKDVAPGLKTDPTAEAMDWRRLRTALRAQGLPKPGMFVAAVEWNEAGKIDQALGDLAPVLVFNADPREFAFRKPSDAWLHHDALIIGRGPTVSQEIGRIAPHFASLTPLPNVWVGRPGKDEIELSVIWAHDLTSPYPQPDWAKPDGAK
jgi:4-amino-4-deoxy-L-arabinose transferase-like glycosyltransferase